MLRRAKKEEKLKKLNMNEIPCTERPYERYEQIGASALSNSELLAIILRTGAKDNDILSLVAEIINLCDSGRNIARLVNIDENELLSIKGIGRIKAAQIICIGELAKRISLSKAEKNLSFCYAKTIAAYYMERLRHFQQERFVLAMLDAKNKLIKDEIISIGTISSTLVSPRDIFKTALRYNAVNIIVLHNHPSGDSRPSKEDIDITGRLVSAGNILGLKVLDHIIIGDKEYYSFKEKGMIS